MTQNPERKDDQEQTQPELPRLENDDTLNLQDTLIFQSLLAEGMPLPTETYDAPNGALFYRLRPLNRRVASLHTHLQAGWGAADLESGKPIIEGLLLRAGYPENQKPKLHNVIMFSPRLHGNSSESAPSRLATTAVSFLKNKGMMVSDGRFLLMNPPALYELSLNTIATMYPPIKGRVTIIRCEADDVGDVVDMIDRMMVKEDFESWLQEHSPTGTMRYPKLK